MMTVELSPHEEYEINQQELKLELSRSSLKEGDAVNEATVNATAPESKKGGPEAKPGSKHLYLHLGIEQVTKALLEDVLAPGVHPEPFSPDRAYFARSYYPPRGTALEFKFQQLYRDLRGTRSVRLSFLQCRRFVNGGATEFMNSRGFISSCVMVDAPTDWMELSQVPQSVYDKVGAPPLGGEPLLISIEPPDEALGYFECRLRFFHDPSAIAPLSLLTEYASGVTDTRNGRIVIGPLSDKARNLLKAHRSRMLSKHVRSRRGTSPSSPNFPAYEPFSAVERTRPPAPKALPAPVRALPAPGQSSDTAGKNKKPPAPKRRGK
ncbi:MAG: hypothetical protein V4681_00920 [Patescibacteria group bacterium]